MSSKKEIIFVICFSITVGSNLLAMVNAGMKYPTEEMAFQMYGNSFLSNSKESRRMAKLTMLDSMEQDATTQLDKIREKLKALKPDISDDRFKIDELKNKERFYQSRIKNVNYVRELFYKNSDNDSLDRKVGIFLAKLFAGPERANNLDEDDIAGFWSGLAQGLTIPASEVMKKRATTTIDTYVGGLWDFLFAKFGDFFNAVRSVLFHSSNEPFDFQKLDGWQKIIMCAYDDINNMLVNVMRDSTRGLDSVSRQFDDDKSDVENKKEIDMWLSLVSGYAEQFGFFIKVFEKHAEYYDSDDIIVFYSNQICQMLQITCKLLLSSKSLKDLDSKLESQKAIIPAIKKNILNLFEQLKFEVKPRPYSIKDNTSGSTSYKQTNYNAYSGSDYGTSLYGNAIPTSYASYGGI